MVVLLKNFGEHQPQHHAGDWIPRRVIKRHKAFVKDTSHTSCVVSQTNCLMKHTHCFTARLLDKLQRAILKKFYDESDVLSKLKVVDLISPSVLNFEDRYGDRGVLAFFWRMMAMR